MSYPYLGDLINHLFGLQLNIPVPMFGLLVASAVMVAIYIATKEVKRFETLGLLVNVKARVRDNGVGFETPAHQLVGMLTFVSVLFGILGARVFHILEYSDEFVANPASFIFSRGGFSIYGGLIFGSSAGIFYLKRHSIPIAPMLDALAPAMILAYAIGRIGCQISGDGDWGIPADMALKPSWLPVWLWAQTYDNNIAGVVIASPGVYPTPLYETAMTFVIFLFLWSIRKKPYQPGMLFSLYLILSGFERLLIEKIRINIEYHLFGIVFTQAEFISTCIIIAGLIIILKTVKFSRLLKTGFLILVFGSLSACVLL